MVVSLGCAVMRTRSFCYPGGDAEAGGAPASPNGASQTKGRTQGEGGASCPCRERKRRPCSRWREEEEGGGGGWKRPRAPPPENRLSEAGLAREQEGDAAVAAATRENTSGLDLFEGLPDDIVVSILCRLSSAASAPSNLVNVMLTCKRLRGLLTNPLVLSKASARSLAVRAKNWSPSAHLFLKMCVDAGNLEACYILGMIRFYCLPDCRSSGAALMAKAAIGSHAASLYSLAVIQFNGSGGSKNDKNLRAGVALCARAAFLGHVDALRELGHCLQDGYGVRQNVAEGRRFLVQANASELASVMSSSGGTPPWTAACPPHAHRWRAAAAAGCPLLSDFGCNVPAPEPHPANRFLADWFGSPGFKEVNGLRFGLRLCSHVACGRPETRPHEFRRCSVCGAVNYCSRACQALDWKLRHKRYCAPLDRWRPPDGEDAGAAAFPPREAPPVGPLFD